MKKLLLFFLVAVMVIPIVSLAAHSSNYLKWKKRFIAVSGEERDDLIQAFHDTFDSADSVSGLQDLSSMSYSELVSMKNQINLAMWNSQEWQEVTVPPGIWEIGKDIPAGHWTIKPVKGCGPWYIIYDSSISDDGHDISYSGNTIMECICDPSSSYYTPEYKTETDIDMENGYFVRLDCSMVFTPYSGKPDLGFK